MDTIHCFIILSKILYRGSALLPTPVPVSPQDTVVAKQPVLPSKSEVTTESGLPPPPAGPDAPPLPSIIKPSNGNEQTPTQTSKPFSFYPSLNGGIDLGAGKPWITQGVINENGDVSLGEDKTWSGQGVINENGEWVPRSADSNIPVTEKKQGDMFDFEIEDDIITR